MEAGAAMGRQTNQKGRRDVTRDDQEMALWTAEYVAARGVSAASASCAADEAVAEFRKRYPPQPTAPAPVWYDEPPFEKDGPTRPCWIAGEPFPCAVYWSGREWRVYVAGDSHVHGLRGRRVCPIIKPQEPTQ